MAPASDAINQVLEHIVPQIQRFSTTRETQKTKQPFNLLLSGLQGSGKSTWASSLAAVLREQQGLKVVVVSLDDFYHSHEMLVRIRNENAENKMLRTRGQPGTHDEVLAQEFFESFETADEICVPVFEKSRFNGEGDRLPASEWHCVSNQPPVDVLIFEGWCIGFNALSSVEVEDRWRRIEADNHSSSTSNTYCTTTLRDHTLEHVETINSNLKRYNNTFMNPAQFQYLIHLDTKDLANVYRWRIDQEHALLAVKGQGMTDEAVIAFVRGYMPAYELYLGRLKKEAFVPHDADRRSQLRIELDVDRNVIEMVEL